MSTKENFIKFIEENTDFTNADESVMLYWNALKDKPETEKPLFTENGKALLKFMRENLETTTWHSKDLADQMGISSRTVSGGMRKLITDGFVDKVGVDPVQYTLTDNGKNINID